MEDTKTPSGPDALIKEKHKQRRHRDGYEEGVSILRKVQKHEQQGALNMPGGGSRGGGRVLLTLGSGC